MNEKDFYNWVIGVLIIVFVTHCSTTAGMEIMKEEAVASGVGQYNPQTKEFEWIKK